MTESARPNRYYRAAELLRDAIRQSRADHRFSKGEDNSIVYMFDTNVVESYLRTTGGEAEAFITFGELFHDQTAVRVGHRLTTEYLLSRGLPGQGGQPVYMSSYHWNETLNRADRVEREVRRNEDIRMPPLNGLESLLDPGEFLDSAARLIPESILEILKRAEAVDRRLRRCFLAEPDDRPLAPIEITEYWGAAHARVRTRDVVKWQSALRRLRKAQAAAQAQRSPVGKYQDNDSKNERAKIEQDAATLAAIEALYRENPEACGDSRELAFLFVTADRAILEAVYERRDGLAAEGIPLFTRHPRVYSPILNFSNMIRVISSDLQPPDSIREVFMEVESAIEQLFEVSHSEMTFGDSSPTFIRKSIGRWEVAARQLIAVNAKFFAEDEQAMKAVAERLSRGEALREASRRLRETISGIRHDHARLLSNQALNNLSQNLTDLTVGRVTHGVRRAPIKIVGVNLVPHRSPRAHHGADATEGLDALLDTLVADKDLDEIRNTIEGLRQRLHREWKQPTGQLLASCVYLAIGAWQSARDCAERCMALVKEPSSRSIIWREGNYAKALALRFAIRSRSDLDEGVEALRKNITEWGLKRDPLTGVSIAPLRDKIEYAALLETAAILQAIENKTPFADYGVDEGPLELLKPHEIISYFDDSVVAMEEAEEILDLNFSGQTDVPYLVEQLRRQLHLNMIGAHLFRKMFGADISSQPFVCEDLAAALLRLDEALSSSSKRPVPAIGLIYQVCARQLVEPSAASKADALALIQDILAKQQQLLPYADLVELIFLRDYFLSPSANIE